MTMTLFDMRKYTTLKWAVPVLMALLLVVMSAACSGEPQVVEKIVEVERVVEVEVPVERGNSEVEALRKEVESLKEALEESKTEDKGSGSSGPGATATPQRPKFTPTPVVETKSVLFVTSDSDSWTQMSALAFANGIETEFLSDRLSDGDNFGFRLNQTNSLYVVMQTPDREVTYNQLKLIREFISAGGKAAIFVIKCNSSEDLRDTIGISCAEANIGSLRPNGQGTLRLDGENFSPLWDGLYLMGECSGDSNRCHVRVEFFAGNSGDFECVAAMGTEIGGICTALYGTIGEGEVMFMSDSVVPFWSAHWFYDGAIQLGDNREAGLRLLQWLVERDEPSARESQSGDSVTLPSGSFNAASILARFSTANPIIGEERAAAVGEIIAQYEAGSADSSRVLDLLHTVAPELSISERRNAADKLSRISADDQWDENETASGVFYLAAFITGDEPNPGERIEAAHEMVALYETGDLDAEQGLDLMDTIAPSLGVNERRQAAAALARLSADDDWDDDDRMEAASEVFRLVTGVPLNAEERMGAAVDLTGVGVKVFDTDDSFDDREIDNATEIIKQSLTGELTSESLQRILSSGN